MAQSIIWSEDALDDVDGIAEFISRDSVHHAQPIIGKIIHIIETL